MSCVTCGSNPKYKCGGCHNELYCGETCQKKDWEMRHKVECIEARGPRMRSGGSRIGRTRSRSRSRSRGRTMRRSMSRSRSRGRSRDRTISPSHVVFGRNVFFSRRYTWPWIRYGMFYYPWYTLAYWGYLSTQEIAYYTRLYGPVPGNAWGGVAPGPGGSDNSSPEGGYEEVPDKK